MKKVISVRFKENGKSYYFDPAGADIKTGEYVIVETLVKSSITSSNSALILSIS